VVFESYLKAHFFPVIETAQRIVLGGLYVLCNENGIGTARVFNRPEFSGGHDFQAKKFGCQCTKSGSHAVGLQEKSSKNLM